MKELIYFILCILQPICLPVPELTTYLYGEKTVGHLKALIIGIIGVMIGLTIMYYVSHKAARYIIRKFNLGDKVKKFAEYVRKYQILIIGFLFVVPILPDEIICIGSPIIGINYLVFIIIAFISKLISISMVVFSENISEIFSVNQSTIIIIEVVLCILATIIFNIIDKRRKK